MLKNTNCFFCQEIEDRSNNILNRDRVVLETKNFVVIPTVGCFQIGYLLVVPKEHYLCFGEFDESLFEELDLIVEKITSYVKKYKGKDCIIFEHGTRDLSMVTATSIMHAHIHIIPFEYDMVSFLPVYCELKKINGFKDLSDEMENYLFLRDKNGNSYIVKNDAYPSQFFRKIACQALGIPKYWNWKEYKFTENMEITLDFYNNLK